MAGRCITKGTQVRCDEASALQQNSLTRFVIRPLRAIDWFCSSESLCSALLLYSPATTLARRAAYVNYVKNAAVIIPTVVIVVV